MSQGERERLEQAIAALEAQRAILGDDVVDSAQGSLRAQLATPSPPRAPSFEGERKLVSVMFADLSGFTALSEALDPEQVRSIVNQCFNLLVPIVEHYGGTVDKFIGDEIMALFGAPQAHENDAERALRAALDMREALAGLNAADGVSLGHARRHQQRHGGDGRARLGRARAVLGDGRHGQPGGAPRGRRP